MKAQLAYLLVQHARGLQHGLETAVSDGWQVKSRGSGVQQCGLFVMFYQKWSFSLLTRGWTEWSESSSIPPSCQELWEVANEDFEVTQGVAFSKGGEGRTRKNAGPLWGLARDFAVEENDLTVTFVKADKKEYTSTHM